MESGCTGRDAEIWSRLASVTDPELDESVTELGFVTGAHIDAGGGVRVTFRLPTYWCAPNFAFLMAEDMRAAVQSLPWANAVTVELQDHAFADEINRGIAGGRSFSQAFSGEAGGDLDEVRALLRGKAFQRRQEVVISDLLARGVRPSELVVMTIADLEERLLDASDGGRLVTRYLERRRERGEGSGGARAFVTLEGAPLEVESFDVYVRSLRRVRLNIEFNGILCTGLMKVRSSLTENTDAVVRAADGVRRPTRESAGR